MGAAMSSVSRHAQVGQVLQIVCDGCGMDPGVANGVEMRVDYGIVGLRRQPLMLCGKCASTIALVWIVRNERGAV